MDVVGREDELQALRRFVERAATGASSAAVLEGEAGVGKSTLWLAATAVAGSAGLRVLSARPTELELGLAHAGLGDLLEDSLDEVLPELPAPRRRALEAALLLTDDDRAVDLRALAVAVRSALQLLAARGPVLVAVDDVQWLDHSSSEVLSIALRRLREERVHVLLARRLVPDTPAPTLVRLLDDRPTERLSVGPLSAGALQGVLRERLGRTLARPTLLRLHEASGGNPFYALELARGLGSDVDPTQPLPVPGSLEALLRARLDVLPRRTRSMLLLVCAHGRLAPAHVDLAALESAFVENVVELGGGVVRFTHPLLASVAYQAATPAARREAHARIADIAEDPLVRARQRALATQEPDAAVAAELETAVAVALARGAPILAAELGEHAARLTAAEDGAARHRRALAAARAHVAAGDVARAHVLGDELLAAAAPGAQRAEALALLADGASLPRMIALLEQAIAEARDSPSLQASFHRRLAMNGRIVHGMAWGERHARTAFELADAVGDDALRAAALSALAVLHFNQGHPAAPAEAERAYELARTAGGTEELNAAWSVLSHVLVWTLQLERGRELLEARYREWCERDDRVAASALWFLAMLELWAGRWERAQAHAESVFELGGNPTVFFPLALVLAHRGEFERARAVTDRALEVVDEQGALLGGLVAVRGVVDAWSGDPAAAAESFRAAEAMADQAEWGEPALRWWRGDAIETLLTLGRAEEAESLLGPWQAAAERTGRDWVLAHVARCRGLVQAARGEVGEALATLEDAAERHAAVGDSFGRSRVLLALGAVRRRARQKRPAREAIQESLAGFESLGAASWVEAARAELGRIGGRSQVEGLTPAERRVAVLVGEGRTNREVAAALFLNERTVATHLTHIYAKLGVRSRTELAVKLQTF
jgi:DNA-binding CsgD family transcriptional regulator